MVRAEPFLLAAAVVEDATQLHSAGRLYAGYRSRRGWSPSQQACGVLSSWSGERARRPNHSLNEGR